MKVDVRPLKGLKEFGEAEEVQMSAWGMGPRGAAPKEVMIAISDNGGLVLGAFDEDKMVGFALTLVGSSHGRTYMYSHMTGVTREYQSRGIGFLLKQKQREISLQRGFDLVAWTFDPIISKNAHFNLRKLGVVSRNYLPNYYGPMDDSLNFGWDTDRFLCEWFIAPQKLEQVRALGRMDTRDAHVAIEKRGEEPFARCADWEVDLVSPLALVDIPYDVLKLKAKNLEEAKRWRTGTREVFQRYFARGYTAVALLEKGTDFRYLLCKAKMPANIFSRSV